MSRLVPGPATKITVLNPDVLEDPAHPTLRELERGIDCSCDPYAEVRRVARKHIRQPGVCEEYLRWVLADGPEPNFPECRCDDCT